MGFIMFIIIAGVYTFLLYGLVHIFVRQMLYKDVSKDTLWIIVCISCIAALITTSNINRQPTTTNNTENNAIVSDEYTDEPSFDYSLPDKDYDDEHSDHDISDIVYVTKTGSKYHKEWCGYLHSSKIPITYGEAIAQGYTACSRCGG